MKQHHGLCDGLANQSTTIVDVIRARAKQDGDRLAMIFLERGEREADRSTYEELDQAARSVATVLIEAGAGAKPVLLALPSGIDFVRCFLGCLYAGAYAVPVPYPTQRRNWERIKNITLDAGPAAILTTRAMARDPNLAQACGGLTVPAIPAEDAQAGVAIGSLPVLSPSDIALIQYTSGSTNQPKGVVVTHRNLMANQAMIKEAFAHDENTVVVSWLPLDHDMGLIGCILQPLYVGGHCVLMSPLAFLQKPSRWLRAVATYRATTSGAPNFAYDLCVRLHAERDTKDLDLSSWQLAFCGAEPVWPKTMRSFAAIFAPSGLDAKALYPTYGLAEATLFVSGRTVGSGVASRVPPVQPDVAVARLGYRDLVSCGWPRQGASVEIFALDQAKPLPPGTIGEICVSGDSVSPGFWSRSRNEITPDSERLVHFAGKTLLRTGDLGFIVNNEIYIAGRLKDMMIIHGNNIFAEDVEATIMSLPEAWSLGTVASFAVEREPGEAIIVVCELIEKHSADGGAAIAQAIKEAVGKAHGAVPAAVLLVSRGTIPRTASGKIRRGHARACYLQGLLTQLSAEASSASAESRSQ